MWGSKTQYLLFPRLGIPGKLLVGALINRTWGVGYLWRFSAGKRAPNPQPEVRKHCSNSWRLMTVKDLDSIVLQVFLKKTSLYSSLGFPGGSDSQESACNAGELGLIPGSRRFLGEGMATHSSILAGEFQGSRSLAMGSQKVRHDWVINTFTFHFHLPFCRVLVPGFHVVTAIEPFMAKLRLLKVSFGPFLQPSLSYSSSSEADVTAAALFLSAVLLTLSAQLSNAMTNPVLALGLGQVPRPYCLVTSC